MDSIHLQLDTYHHPILPLHPDYSFEASRSVVLPSFSLLFCIVLSMLDSIKSQLFSKFTTELSHTHTHRLIHYFEGAYSTNWLRKFAISIHLIQKMIRIVKLTVGTFHLASSLTSVHWFLSLFGLLHSSDFCDESACILNPFF